MKLMLRQFFIHHINSEVLQILLRSDAKFFMKDIEQGKRVKRIIAFIILVFFSSPALSQNILYKKDGGNFWDGEYGQIRLVQGAINSALQKCGNTHKILVDGEFGRGTVAALKMLAGCAEFSGTNLQESLAQGHVTEAAWRLLLPDDAVPSVHDRAMGLVLAYEATDYARAEWNFCQNRPLYNPAGGNGECYSNDKASYLTWGPRGATAGHGQEVVVIISLIDQQAPTAIDDAFEDDADGVRLMTSLSNVGENPPLERYLCSIWLEPSTRASWKRGFANLAKDARVRELYDSLYASASFDGGKIAAFYAAWAEVDRTPTEIDYAFFLDRATHMSIRKDPIVAALRTALMNGSAQSPADLRRAVSLAVLPSNSDQANDRLGRDVSFYADDIDELSNREQTAWQARGARLASDVGLSDLRQAPAFVPTQRLPWTGAQATSSIDYPCPDQVLNSKSPS